MSIIFRKTAKGVHEIETRAYRLPLRVRNVLILVDGRRDVTALRGLVPQQVDDMLDMLVAQAFIEAAGQSAPVPRPRAPPKTCASRPRHRPLRLHPHRSCPSTSASGRRFAT